MTSDSLNRYFEDRRSDPAIRLLAQTTAAVRADAAFVQKADDAAGGALLAEEAPAALTADALAAVMARIDQTEALDHRAAVRAEKGSREAEIAALPSPVREAALTALQKKRWKFGGFGIRRLPLLTGDSGSAELMRIEPGRGVADHDHGGDELTLILTGGYHDGHAHYLPGDITLARPDFVHHPKADLGEVCYVLAVSYGPPKFSGVFGVLQWFLGSPRLPTSAG